jgi:hypothetical protein
MRLRWTEHAVRMGKEKFRPIKRFVSGRQIESLREKIKITDICLKLQLIRTLYKKNSD